MTKRSISGTKQHIALWTDIDPRNYNSEIQEPVQKFKFVVDLHLYKGRINRDGTISDPGLWRPAQHLIKSIDLPTTQLGSFENKMGAMNTNDSVSLQAQDAKIDDLTITFYLTRALALSLRQAYFTYYAEFTSKDSNGKPIGKSAPVIFQTGGTGTLTVQDYFRKKSRIVVTLISSTTTARHYDPLVATEEDALSATGGRPGVTSEKTQITYYNIAPISLDLGELAYGDSEIVEAKMVFNIGALGLGKETTNLVANPPPDDGKGADDTGTDGDEEDEKDDEAPNTGPPKTDENTGTVRS